MTGFNQESKILNKYLKLKKNIATSTSASGEQINKKIKHNLQV